MQYQKNGKIIYQDAVFIEDRAFSYGDGCFTTARLKQGEIILWERHLQRLKSAIQRLRLNCDIESIKKEKLLFLQQLDEKQSGIIKIIISRGVGQRGYAIPKQPCDVYFCFYPVTTTSRRGVLHTPDTDTYPASLKKVGLMPEPLGTPMSTLKGIKTLNRLEQVMLKDFAIQQQWDEAFCFDRQQHLVEGISSNCFVYLDQCWVTPDLALTGIEGIMRLEILERMKYYEIPHQIRMISHTEIPKIQAGFFCNALYPMQKIEQLCLDAQSLDMDTSLCLQLFEILQLKTLV